MSCGCNTRILTVTTIDLTGVDFTELTQEQVNQIFNQLDFNELDASDCQVIFQCIIDNATPAQLVSFLQLLDFTQLTAAQCEAIAGCIDFTTLQPQQCIDLLDCMLTNVTTTQITQLSQLIDFCQLTPAQITCLSQAVDFTQLTTEQVTNLTQVIDFTQLTVQQITDITQLIDFSQLTTTQVTELTELIDISQLFTNLTTVEQAALCSAIIDAGCDFSQIFNVSTLTTAQLTELFDAICATNPTLFNAHANGDGTVVGSGTGPIPVQCGSDLLLWSSDNSILLNLTSGSAIYDLTINPAFIAGLDQFEITNIELAPTGNPNEFGVSISWIDETGTAQTTVDPTPITIDQTCINSSGPAEPITQANSVLSDGTVVDVTGGVPLSFSSTTPGDIRYQGTVTITTSKPSRLIVTPTTFGDPVILDPLTWTYQNGTSPTHPSASRLSTNGDDVIVIPGTEGLIVADGQFARAGQGDVSGLTASSDWGTVIANNGTEFTIRAKNSDAVNVQVQPLEVQTICDILTNQDIAISNLQQQVLDVANSDLLFKSQECYIEAGAGAPLVGVNANNMTGDLDDDDFFQAEIENTTGGDIVVTGLRLTTGLWTNPTPNNINAFFGGSSGTVSIPANPGGDFEIIFDTPVTVLANSTLSGFVGTQTFGSPQPITATQILVSAQIEHQIYTYYEDGVDVLVEFDTNGDPQPATVDPLWTPCPALEVEELAAVQNLVDEKPNTKNVQCFTDSVGPNQLNVFDVGFGLHPTVPQTLSYTAADTFTSNNIEIRFHDQANNLDLNTTLEIYADGVLVATRTYNHLGGGGIWSHYFGPFDFVSGVEYDFVLSADDPAIRVGGTTEPVGNQITFDTPVSAGSGVPLISLEGSGTGRFTVATLTDGTQIACDSSGNEIPVDSAWIPCNDLLSDNQILQVQDLIGPATTAGVQSVIGEHVDNTDPFNPIVRSWVKEDCYEEALSDVLLAQGASGGSASFFGNNLDTQFTPSSDGTLTDMIVLANGAAPSDSVVITFTNSNGTSTGTFVRPTVFPSVPVTVTLDTPLPLTAGDPVSIEWPGTLNGGGVTTTPATADFVKINGGSTIPSTSLLDNSIAVRTVRTYDDGSLYTVDKDANIVAPLASVPGTWTPCAEEDLTTREINCLVAANVDATGDTGIARGENSDDFVFVAPFNGTVSSFTFKLENTSAAVVSRGITFTDLGGATVTEDVPVGVSNVTYVLPTPFDVVGGQTYSINTLQLTPFPVNYFTADNLSSGVQLTSTPGLSAAAATDVDYVGEASEVILSDGSASYYLDGVLQAGVTERPTLWTSCPSLSGDVKVAVSTFTSTNGVKVDLGAQYIEFPNSDTWATPTVAEYNEFINNYRPHYVALSYEAAGGANVTINVNGVDAIYTDLVNATDTGNGRVAFAGGANGAFNRLARVDAEVLREVGDYIEIINPDVSPFSQQIIAITTDPADLAHTTGGVYNFRVAAGSNGLVESYNFRDKTNTVVVSGAETDATYRITRTLAGLSFARNGVELYCTELSEFTDYRATIVGDGVHYREGTSIADTDYKLVNSVLAVTSNSLPVPLPGPDVVPGSSVSIRNISGGDLTLSGASLSGDGDLVIANGEAAELVFTGTQVWYVS